MKSKSATIFLIFGITFSILISSSITNLAISQGENKTISDGKNNTRRIINLVNNTITVIDKTTNETISTIPYLVPRNNTSNDTMNNESLSTNEEKNTTNNTLSEKFESLNK